MCDRKAVIKNADMSEEMQQDAVDCATQALEKFNIEKVGHFSSGLLVLYLNLIVLKGQVTSSVNLDHATFKYLQKRLHVQ